MASAGRRCEDVERAEAAGLSWAEVEALDGEALERRLFPPPTVVAAGERLVPEWSEVQAELRRSGVTLKLVWEEYRGVHPEVYGYSRFCELYEAWLQPMLRTRSGLETGPGVPNRSRRSADDLG